MDFNSANTISAFLSSILLLLIVCYIAFRDWRDLINRYYAFFALMISGMMLTMYLASAMQDSPHLTLISRMTRSFMMMSFFGYFSLSLIFSGSGKTFRALNVLLSAIPAVLTAIASASTDMVISRVYLQGGYALTEYGRFYWIFALMALLYLLAGIVNSIRKYLVMDVELYRLQMRYIFTGSSTALLFVAAVSLILPWWSGYSRLQVMGPAAASLLIIISLFYSVAVHNIMGINTNLHRTMIYILVSITVFVPIYAIIVFYYARMFHLDWLPLPVLALLIVGVFLIISTFIQPVIDRIFRRRRYEFETVTDSFLRRVEDVHDPLRVVDETVDALYQSLNLSSAFFLRYDPAVRSYGMISGRSAGEDLSVESLERNAPLILWFIRNHEILSLNRVHADREALSEIRDDAISFFSSAKISVILPYYHYNRLTGLLCLGPKISMAGFTSEEMGILEAFRQESNEVISTAVTYEMAREEQFIARTLSLSSYILSRSTPARLPHMQGIRFGGFVISRYGRGVDYFDFIRSSDEGIGVIAADVAGVGINSALYSVVLRSAFRSSVGEAQST